MLKQVKIYGINSGTTANKIIEAIDNIDGVRRVLIEMKHGIVYIHCDKEIDDNIIAAEICFAGFDIM